MDFVAFLTLFFFFFSIFSSIHLPTDKRITSTLTKEQLSEAGRLFNFIVKLRVLQQEIEETSPELAAEKAREWGHASDSDFSSNED